MGDDSGTLGFAFLENFFDSRQARYNVAADRSDTASVEGAHSELGAGFADSLGRHRTNRLSQFNRLVITKIYAVTLHAQPVYRSASQRRANIYGFDRSSVDYLRIRLSDQVSALEEKRASIIGQVSGQKSASNIPREWHLDTGSGFFMNDSTLSGIAIFFGHDFILRYIEEPAGEITGLGGIQGRIGHTFSTAMSSDKIFQRSESFFVTGYNGKLE